MKDLETILSQGIAARHCPGQRYCPRPDAAPDYLAGGIIVTEKDKEIRFETEAGAEEMALRMVGSGSQVFYGSGGRICMQYVSDRATKAVIVRVRGS